MKNRFFLALVACLISQVSLAQSTRFGLKGGLNVDNISTNFPILRDGKENILAFNAGVLVDVGVSNRFSLQPQLLYNVKDIKFTVPDHSHTIRLQSVDLPIYAVYKPLPGLSIGAGPNFGYNLSGKNVAAFATGDEVHAYAFSNADYDFKRFDFGVGGLMATSTPVACL